MLFTSGATGPPKGVVYRHRQLRGPAGPGTTVCDITPTIGWSPRSRPFALYGPALGIGAGGAGHGCHQAGHPHGDRAGRGGGRHRRHPGLRLAGGAAERRRHRGRADCRATSALARIRLVLSAGAPVPVALLRRRSGRAAARRAAHAVRDDRGPAGDRHLARRDRRRLARATGCASGGRCPACGSGSAPLDSLGRAAGPTRATRRGHRGDLCVARHTSRSATTGCGRPRAASSRDPGWHRTGDVGHLDAAGRLWVEGRLVHVDQRPLTDPLTPVGIEQRIEAGCRDRGRRGGRCRTAGHPAGGRGRGAECCSAPRKVTASPSRPLAAAARRTQQSFFRG